MVGRIPELLFQYGRANEVRSQAFDVDLVVEKMKEIYQRAVKLAEKTGKSSRKPLY